MTQAGPPGGNQPWDPQQPGGSTPSGQQPPAPGQPAPGQQPPSFDKQPPAPGQQPPSPGQQPPAFGQQQPPPYGQQQPPQYGQGQQPPPFGQPSGQAPGQQPPPYGQPMYGQPPGYGQPGPPPPAKKNRTGLIIAIVAAAVVVIAIVIGAIVFATGGSDKNSSAFTADNATKVAQRYLDDINSGDKSNARSLLCASAVPSFDKNVNSSSSDFLVTIDSSNHVSTTKDGENYSVEIDAQGHERADETNTFDVRFTFQVVNENGPKICDESVVNN